MDKPAPQIFTEMCAERACANFPGYPTDRIYKSIEHLVEIASPVSIIPMPEGDIGTHYGPLLPRYYGIILVIDLDRTEKNGDYGGAIMSYPLMDNPVMTEEEIQELMPEGVTDFGEVVSGAMRWMLHDILDRKSESNWARNPKSVANSALYLTNRIMQRGHTWEEYHGICKNSIPCVALILTERRAMYLLAPFNVPLRDDVIEWINSD